MPQSAARRKVRVHRSCQLTCGDGQQLPVLERADVGEVVQVACSHTGKEQSARRGRMRHICKAYGSRGGARPSPIPLMSSLSGGMSVSDVTWILRISAPARHGVTSRQVAYNTRRGTPRRRRAPTVGRVDLEVIELRAEHQCHLDHAAGSLRNSQQFEQCGEMRPMLLSTLLRCFFSTIEGGKNEHKSFDRKIIC